MSNIWKALPHFLLADTSLGELVDVRIFPMRIPQGESLPAITYQDISTTNTQTHGERSALPRKRFQFTIHGGSIAAIDAVAQALQNRLDGFRGTMGAGAFLTYVDGVLIKNDIHNDDSDTGIMQRIQDYIILYKE